MSKSVFKIIVSVLLVLIVVDLTIYYIISRNNVWPPFLLKKDLPFNMQPMFYSHYPQAFCLLDSTGIPLLYPGLTFQNDSTNFGIKEIVEYGYDDTTLVSACVDSSNSIKYFRSRVYCQQLGPEIDFFEISIEQYDILRYSHKYTWVNVKKSIDKAYHISVCFFRLLLILVSTLIAILLLKFIYHKCQSS